MSAGQTNGSGREVDDANESQEVLAEQAIAEAGQSQAMYNYSQKLLEQKERELMESIAANYGRIREVERELGNLQLQLKLTAGPKKHALELLRKKIEAQNERVAYVRAKHTAAKATYEKLDAELKAEEAAKDQLCTELNTLVQQAARAQLGKLEELKTHLESLYGSVLPRQPAPPPPPAPPAGTSQPAPDAAAAGAAADGSASTSASAPPQQNGAAPSGGAGPSGQAQPSQQLQEQEQQQRQEQERLERQRQEQEREAAEAARRRQEAEAAERRRREAEAAAARSRHVSLNAGPGPSGGSAASSSPGAAAAPAGRQGPLQGPGPAGQGAGQSPGAGRSRSGRAAGPGPQQAADGRFSGFDT